VPFKTTPAKVVIIGHSFENAARRLFGRRHLWPPDYDPEVCSANHAVSIMAALDYVAAHVQEIKDLGAECLTLGTCLAGKNVNSLYITCANCDASGNEIGAVSSDASDGSLQVCLSAYGNYAITQSTVNSLVLRELVRMCGGVELDAWAMDYYLSRSVTYAGTSWLNIPSIIKNWMCAGSAPYGTGTAAVIRIGTFFVWNTSTGALLPKVVRAGAPVGWLYPSLTGTSNSAWAHTCP
jgi:hypothetical protein